MKSIFNKDVVTRMSSFRHVTVAVHDFTFHADDVFSIALLKELANVCDFTLEVIRTRKPEELQKATMRVDVGLKYSEETLDFDHHQDDHRLMQAEKVKHSAFGLLCKWCLTEEFLQLFKYKYVLGLEHRDNTGKIHEKYADIGNFMPAFLPAYEENVSFDEMFEEAVAVASIILRRCMKSAMGLLKGEQDIVNVISDKLANGNVIVMERRIIVQQYLHPDWKFIISPDPSGGWGFLGMNGQLLKPELRGLNAETLAQKGYNGRFTHVGGFTGILETKEEAIRICLESI